MLEFSQYVTVIARVTALSVVFSLSFVSQVYSRHRWHKRIVGYSRGKRIEFKFSLGLDGKIFENNGNFIKMNLLPVLVFISLVLMINSHSVSCGLADCHTGRTFAPTFRKNATENFLRPRQMIGFSDVKSFFDIVYRYFSGGVSYIVGKFGKFVSSPKGSKKKKVSYKGYQVLRIEPVSERQVEHLKDLQDEIEGTEFWTPPIENYYADLLVAPDSVADVKDYLKEKDIDYETLIRDLQKVIAHENPKMNKEQRDMLIGKRGHPMTWMRYHRYADMIRYMEFLAFSYPQNTELITIGYTTEGLPLKVLKVFSDTYRKDNDEDEKKPSFWIDGGMHGREWITSSAILYIVRQFVENYSKHKETVDSAVWYFLPVANPDGYEYSHTTDRLWRKTRSKHDISDYSFIRGLLYGYCEGVDLNRNFDFHWGEKGVSEDPCQERYAGPRPFSEPETKAISNFIMNKKDRIRLYITLHAYSQMWLVPWSYTTKKTSDYADMEKVAKKAVQAIAFVTGSHYDVGPSSSLIYPVSGTSEDWAKGVAGIKYSYAVKLRDRGSFGFLLPAAEIVPTSKELFVAMKVMAKMIGCVK